MAGIKNRLSKEHIKEIVRLRQEEDYSYSLIGRKFNRDHSTIIFHCQRAGLPMHHIGKVRYKSAPILKYFNLEPEQNTYPILKYPELKQEQKRYFKIAKAKYSEYETLFIKSLRKKKFFSEKKKNRTIKDFVYNYRHFQYNV